MQTTTKERLYSLDLLRGLDIFFLTVFCGTPLVAITSTAAKTFSQGFAHLFGEGWAVFLTSIVQGVLVTFALIVRRRLKSR